MFAAGFAVSFFTLGQSTGQEVGQSTQEFPLLAKRIFIDNPNNIRINFSDLRSELRNYFEENNIEGSLYFEYLPTGTSVRVNGDERYRAASLIKLPVAMEVYKAQEKGLLKLSDKVALKQEWLNDGYGSLYEKGVGYELTLGEAVDIMLKESDNTALRILLDATSGLDVEDRALGSLDIEFTLGSDDGIDVGTRSYSSFLKCLYFACYNSPEDSQQILDTLTETPFSDRIVAGIGDESVKIAHKIGVFNSQVQGDCGIVYVENNNYVLCLMIEGNDDQQTNQHFSALSKLTYDYVAN